MKRALYIILFLVWYLISLLPLWILYGMSEFLYIIAYRLWGYRKKLVRRHLAECFPEKSEDERRKIEREYYHWFCDYIVETLKLLTISKDNIKRRIRFENTDRVKQSFDEGRNVALYLGHYCNWEWVSSIPLHFEDYQDKVVFGQIYHKLENEEMNKLFLRLRGRNGAESIPMSETLRRIVEIRRQRKLWIVGFIADQVPMWNNIHLWLDFLHHDTPVFTGSERIARKFDSDVYYIDIRRERRGYYMARFVLMAEHAASQPEGELTRMRASLVCENALFGFAQQIDLGSYLRLGKGEEMGGGRHRPSVVSDAFEAVIAALYLDGGIETARRFILPFVTRTLTDAAAEEDYKTRLQEIVQQNPEERLRYVVARESGPDHDKHFEVDVYLNSNAVGHGEGHSKKQAEQAAAKEALALMGY